MSILSPEQWQALSPYIEQALALSENERAVWLASLGEESPKLAEQLRGLLAEHRELANERFLEQPAISPAAPGLAGQTIGAYTMVSFLGHGGMGSVWLAERNDGRFQRRAAVKFLSLALVGHGGQERFKREGKILGRLAHPNIAELLDAGVSPEGQPYLVLEHVEGEQIDRYCDDRRLDVTARLRLFLDVLAAVAHAHANLIVHRDLKPSNVLVRNDGQVKLLDFGIAKLLEEGEQAAPPTKITQEEGGALTLAYAAPEQVTGGAVTTATDAYALGVLLYVLLTGQHPAGGSTRSAAELVKAIVDSEPRRASDVVHPAKAEAESVFRIAAQRATTPEKLARLLRGDLDTILSKALKKGPQQRYTAVTAFADDIRRCLRDEPISARPDTLAYRAGKFVRRNRMAVALATIALLAVISGVTGILMQARIARQQRDTALRERDRANRVADFMVQIFRAPDPTQTRGNTITARELLDKGSTEIGSELVKDPDLQARMMHSMGIAYRMLGLYPTAQSLLEKSIATARRASSGEDREVLSTMLDLGVVLTEQGRLSDAEKLQREAIALGRKSLGLEDPLTLKTMSDLARTLSEEGRHGDDKRQAEALALAGQTLDIQRRVAGAEDVHTLWTMHIYAMILERSKHYAEAEKLQREELAIEQRVHGPDSLGAMNAMGNLGITLVDMGRLAEAESVLLQTREIQSRVYGPDHPITRNSDYNLACIAARQGHQDQAFAWLNAAVPFMPVRGLLWIEKDSDLDSLHADPRWAKVVRLSKQRVVAANQTSH